MFNFTFKFFCLEITNSYCLYIFLKDFLISFVEEISPLDTVEFLYLKRVIQSLWKGKGSIEKPVNSLDGFEIEGYFANLFLTHGFNDSVPLGVLDHTS